MKWLSIILISLAALLTLPAPQVHATTVVSLSDESLVSLADFIVHGVIESTEPVRFSDGMILTRVTIRVQDWLKPDNDDAPERFDFYTRGGTLGDITVSVPGEMTPVVGTEVVVFLERIPRFNHVPMLLGLLQGAFFVDPPVMTAADGTQPRRIRQNLDNLSIHRFHGMQHSGFSESQTLGELIGKIRQILENTP